MGSASSFNGDLSSWDVSKVTDMSWMFSGASSFNGDLSSWDVSQVTKMDNMFMSASNFNGDLRSWDVSKVTDMGKMFCESGFQRKMQWDCTGLVDDYYTAHNSWSGSSGGSSDDYYKAHNSWSGSSGPSDDWTYSRFPQRHACYNTRRFYNMGSSLKRSWKSLRCKWLRRLSKSLRYRLWRKSSRCPRSWLRK